MKRIGYIYEQIISIENCRQAIINASKHKRKRQYVIKILDNIEFYTNDLHNRLIQNNFTSPYKKQIIKDGLSGKVRELQIPLFYPDQCAHHAIIQILQPIILKSSYYWSCANIPNRGIDRACIGVERATRRDIYNSKYCVKMDIKKFYPSIPHDKLKDNLKRKFKDEKALRLIYTVIDSHSPGLPIGNYTSPWLAELYLQPLDGFIKQSLNIKHYIRYADDLVLIDEDKDKLREALYSSINFIINKLNLEVKNNYQLFKIQEFNSKHGRKIDFVGRCFGMGFTTVRKRKSLKFMRQSRRIYKQKNFVSFREASGFISRSSCLYHTNSNALKQKYYCTIDIKKLKEIIRYESLGKCNS